MLRFPRSRYSFQPQEVAGVEWSDPLAAELRSLVVALPVNAQELVTQRHAPRQLGTAFSPVWFSRSAEIGNVIDGAASSNSHALGELPEVFNASTQAGVTMFAVTQNDRAGADPVAGGFIVALASTVSNNTLVGLGPSASARAMRFQWRDSSNVLRVNVSSASDIWAAGDTGAKVIAVAWGGAGDFTMACNGEILGQVVANAPLSITPAGATTLGYGALVRASPGSSARLKVAAGGAWSRRLSDQELINLTLDPWRLVAVPRGRSFVPVAFSVGGIAYTLTTASLAHSQAVSAPSLPTRLGLNPGAIAHAQTLPVGSLSTRRSLSAGSLSHGQTIADASLSGAGALTSATMTHSQTLSAPSLSTVTALVSAALAHAQSLAVASLGAAYPLSAASLAHTLSLDAAVASTLRTIAAAAMTHTQTFSQASASTTGAANLIAGALAHVSTLDAPSLSTLIALAPNAMAHAQALAAVSLSATTGAQLAAAGLAHVHTFGAAPLSTELVLSAAALEHTLSVGATSLSTSGSAAIVPGSLSHAHILAAVVLATSRTITPGAMLHQQALSALQLIYDDGSAESLVGKKIHLLIQRRQFTSHKQSDGSLVVVFHPISLVDITDNKCIC